MKIFVIITNSDDKKVMIKRIFYIYYLVWFNKNETWGLVINKNKVNAINPNYTQILDLKICEISIKLQRINSSTLITFEIVITNF